MAGVVFSPVAAKDLDGIAAHISQDKPQAALRWLHNIEAACHMLAVNPGLGESRLEFPGVARW